jgi:hypothetical protein
MTVRPKARVQILERILRTFIVEDSISFGSDPEKCDVSIPAKGYNVGLHAVLKYDEGFYL